MNPEGLISIVVEGAIEDVGMEGITPTALEVTNNKLQLIMPLLNFLIRRRLQHWEPQQASTGVLIINLK